MTIAVNKRPNGGWVGIPSRYLFRLLLLGAASILLLISLAARSLAQLRAPTDPPVGKLPAGDHQLG
ncbi:MAG TPA: hypothetical protein VH298_12975, partial [Jatrophihabitans sp.]|nr:hypothetical protein [Jatrophihabitans sp.]